MLLVHTVYLRILSPGQPVSEPASSLPRRRFLSGVLGVAGSAALITQFRAIGMYAASTPEQARWEFFTPGEAADFEAVAAQIVPTDDTPGAREARVVRFADRGLASLFRNTQDQFRNDLKLLGDYLELRAAGTRSFARLEPERQLALLADFERNSPAVFGRLRQMVMRGMFSHPIHGGNYRKIGWRLIGFDDPGSWKPPFGYYDRE